MAPFQDDCQFNSKDGLYHFSVCYGKAQIFCRVAGDFITDHNGDDKTPTGILSFIRRNREVFAQMVAKFYPLEVYRDTRVTLRVSDFVGFEGKFILK